MFIQNDRSNSHNVEINDTELRATAPSVFAESAMPGASSRYTFLPTAKIVEAMRAEGWKPYAARQSRPRTEARRGFQIHQVTFQRRDQIAAQGEYAPEVVLLNSHDRSSGYELRAGLYRFVCSNGLLVADSLLPAIHVRHTGQELQAIIAASFSIMASCPASPTESRSLGALACPTRLPANSQRRRSPCATPTPPRPRSGQSNCWSPAEAKMQESTFGV